jgi:hypothetical protein
MRFSLFPHRRLRRRDVARDSYLTDGVALLRVDRRFVAGGSLFVSIEDCVTLEVRTASVRELAARNLRPVRFAEARTGGAPSRVSTRCEDPAIVH